MSNMVVRTNTLALNSHRNLGMVGNQQARSSARLSSGFRINSAADDAAGLGISENMRSQIRGLDQASRNSQDAISLIQTAEGGLNTINEMVIRVRELTVQAANDINTSEGAGSLGDNESNRARIQGEINHLIDEIQRTATTLQFNSMTLLDGSIGSVGAVGSVTAESLLNGDFELTAAFGDLAAGDEPTMAQMDMIRNILSVARQHDLSDAITADTLDPTHADFNQGHVDFVQALRERQGTADWSAIVDLDDVASIEQLRGHLNALDAGLGAPGEGLWMQVGANSGQGIVIELPNVITDVADALRTAFDSPAFGQVNNNSSTGAVATGDGESISQLLDDVDAVLAGLAVDLLLQAGQ